MNYKDIKEGKYVTITQPGKVKLPDGTIKEQAYTWKGEVVKMVDNSRTKVIIRDTDRGPGWDEASQSYKGVSVKNGWYRGENRNYGDEIEVHIKYVEYTKKENQ